MILYFDTQRTKDLATDVIRILRSGHVYVTKFTNQHKTQWYHAYINGEPDCVLRVFYNVYENHYNSAVVDFYYKDPYIKDVLPGFRIDEQYNKRELHQLIRKLNHKACIHKIALRLGIAHNR